MAKERHIVILRFSAIGDVAIAAPIVRAYAKANPDCKFTMSSQSFLKTLFDDIPNLDFFPVDFSGENHNIKAVVNCAKQILKLKPTAIADIHDVLRSKLIRMIASFNGIETKVIDMGREEKKDLIKHKKGSFKQLKTSARRYEDVFIKLGFDDLHVAERKLEKKSIGKYQFPRIGIAPFARHEGKCWHINNMERLVSYLSGNPNAKLYLFGSKGYEAQVLQRWQDTYPNCESVAGKHTLEEELEFIKSLDLMISMDSANMHLASFAHIPVISIWGATHPYAGFYGWGQDADNAIGINIECRPCSVFGNKKCARGDYACLNRITPEMIISKLRKFYGKES